MRYRAAVLLLLASVPFAPGAAQWSVALEIGLLRFGGAATDTAAPTDPLSFRPAEATAVGLRVDRALGRVCVGLGLLYATPDLAAEGNATLVVAKQVFTLYEVAPEIAVRLASTGPGVVLRLHAGPVVDIWEVNGDPGRTRTGAQAAVSIEFPIGSRLTGSMRAQGVLTPSVFEPAEPPAEYERRAMRRGGVALGLRYRL